MDDLQKFFDCFAKSKDNGWYNTPRLRLSLLSMVSSVVPSVVERAENTTTFPLPRTYMKKLYLDASNMQLEPNKPAAVAKSTYEGHSLTDQVVR
jgi:hypothetical protein